MPYRPLALTLIAIAFLLTLLLILAALKGGLAA